MTVRLIPDWYLVGARNRLTQAGISGMDADYAIAAVGLANRAAWRFENHGRLDLDKDQVARSQAFPDLTTKPVPIEAALDNVVEYMLKQCITEGGVDFSPRPQAGAMKAWARRKNGEGNGG